MTATGTANYNAVLKVSKELAGFLLHSLLAFILRLDSDHVFVWLLQYYYTMSELTSAGISANAQSNLRFAWYDQTNSKW